MESRKEYFLWKSWNRDRDSIVNSWYFFGYVSCLLFKCSFYYLSKTEEIRIRWVFLTPKQVPMIMSVWFLSILYSDNFKFYNKTYTYKTKQNLSVHMWLSQTWSASQQSIHCYVRPKTLTKILLLIDGQVECNPGPIKYPCGI